MGFKFSTEVQKTLTETFNAVKGKTWTRESGDFEIKTMREFSSVLGECMGEAVSEENSKLSFAFSSDDDLAKAACKIMKEKLGI